MKISQDYMKEAYSIPQLSVGGSTRTDTVTTGGGVGNVVKIISGSDSATLTMSGIRVGTTDKVSLEQLTLTSTGTVSSVTTDWLYFKGASMTDKYGQSLSTQSVDTYFYATSTSGSEVCLISSSEKSKKMVVFQLTGKNTTIHNISGNLYANSVTFPTSNNSFKMTDAMISDERIVDYLFLQSDTGGCTAQVKVWRD